MTALRPRRFVLALTASLAAFASMAQAPAVSFANGDTLHVCAVLDSAKVSCWGDDDIGFPHETPGITTAVQASGSFFGANCAVLTSGRLNCWGVNAWGQLGDGTKSGKNSPVEAKGITNALQVSAGYQHMCAALASGKVNCWGSNPNGELGDGSYTISTVPVEVSGISSARQVSAGSRHSCALLISGKVNCWGDNARGQLGDGSYTSSPVPVEVSGITNATQVSAGAVFSCALLASDKVKCWGSNGSWQLGTTFFPPAGDPIFWANVPREIPGLSDVKQVSAGSSHACALLASGKVKCWGQGEGGGLGNGTQDQSSVPVEVSGISTAKGIITGQKSGCAVLASGKVNCWGINENGQLGNGESDWRGSKNSSLPVEVHNLSNAANLEFDLTAPAAAVLSGVPSNPTDSKSADISFAAEEGTSSWCSVDGAAYEACSSPSHLTGLEPGDHTFNVTQRDASGNVSEPATAEWTVIELGEPTIQSRVRLRFNFQTRVTTLKLSAVADTRIAGNSIEWVEYFSHPRRPSARARQNERKMRPYATSVVLPAKEVAFWVRFKDARGKWSGWHWTKK